MKLQIRLFLTILVSIFGSTGYSGLIEVTDFGSNPGNLKMFLYVPSTLPDSINRLPLVVALHGCSQNAESIAKQSGWNELADKYHFAVLYPQQKRTNNPSNCFNWFRPEDIESKKGESISIKNMIDFVIDSISIDTSSIFVYGLSAGAAMGVAILANYPNTFKSGAIFAGGPYKSAKNGLEAFRNMVNPPNKTGQEWGEAIILQDTSIIHYPHLIVFHGKKDIVVDFQNSKELIKQWTYIHQIDALPGNIIHSFSGNPFVERSSYLDADSTEIIVFYTISNMGHALPVDPGKGDKQGGDTGPFAVDKDFFSTYYVAKDFGLIK